MKIFLLVCLIGFVAGAAFPDAEVPEATAPEHPGIYGISDDEKVCIENYLNREVLDLECEGSIRNVVDRLTNKFGSFDTQIECAQRIVDEYKYKDVYLQYEYNVKTHGKTHELSKLARAAVKGMKTFCEDFMENYVYYAIFNYESQNVSEKYSQCAYRYSIEKEIIKTTDFNIDPKDFDSVDCKSFYEEWSSKPPRPFVVDICDDAHRSEFEKCFHNRPSMIHRDLERFALASVAKLDTAGIHVEKVRQDYMMTMFITERSGLECIRELAGKVLARS